MRDLHPCPPCGRQGRPGEGFLAGSILRAAGERPPRARPQRRGSPGPIPNPAVKPAFAESTAARGCGRAGRRARGGRFSICADRAPAPTGRRPPLPGRARGAPRARARRAGPRGARPLGAGLGFGRHWSARRRDRCRGPSTWPADCVGASHAPKSHRGESSLWDFLRFEVEKRLLDVWLFSVRVLWSHAGSRFRLLPNCV